MRALESRSRIPSFGPVGWVMLSYVILFALYTFLVPGGSAGRMATLDVRQMLILLLPAALCWGVSHRLDTGRERWSWRLLALSNVSWVAGQAGWSYCELVLRVDVPAIYRLGVLWALYYPLAFAGIMLRIPPGQGSFGGLSTIFDALLFTLAAGGLSWQFLLAPSLATATDPLAAALHIANPLGDILITFALASRILRLPVHRIPASSFYLLGAFLLLAVADTANSVLVLDAAYRTGNPIDYLWQWVHALVGLAALADLKDGSWTKPSGDLLEVLHPGWRRGVGVLLPYSALPAAFLLLHQSFNPAEHGAEIIPRVSLAIAVALVVLVLLRQLSVLMENNGLSHSLAARSQQLEARVAQRTVELARRTEELVSLNQIATYLSHCRSAEEVLSYGVEMACEATRSSGGAVWLLKSGGHTELAASHGLSTTSLQRMADLPLRDPALLQTLTRGEPAMLFEGELRSHALSLDQFSPPVSHLFTVPLLSRGSILGVLGLLESHQVEDGSSSRDLATAVGAQLGVALESARRYEDARILADRDSVTGLLNHRAIHERLEQELNRARRGQEELALVILDIDGFKLFNDTYGHPVGDQVLRLVAGLIRDSARTFDIIGRYGGDEFVIILPGTGTEGGVAFAERLRSVLAAHPHTPAEGGAIPIHLSLGVAACPRNGSKSHELVGFADANLYQSKERGGDTITTDGGQGERDQPALRTFGVLDGLVTAVDHKDRYTRKHSEGVTGYALAIAQALGISEEAQRTLRMAGLLHDVGKICVPDNILRKPGRLTEQEFTVVKQHALLGEMIIKEVPNISAVLAAVGSHHERFDGTGYPRSLKEAEISWLGRILAVSDAYSAMTTDRPYRMALSAHEARAELLRVAGTQLDPHLVRVFLNLAPAGAAPATEAALSSGDGAGGSRPPRLVLINR